MYNIIYLNNLIIVVKLYAKFVKEISMTIKEAQKLLKCSKQNWYYYKKKGLIHIRDYQVDDDEVWAILDSKTKPLTKEKKLDILEGMITLSCELKGQFTINELAYALLKTNLLTYQQQNDLIEALEL